MIKLLTLAVVLATSTSAMAQGLSFKDKLKPGEYDYNVSMEMGKVPGMPEGMQGMKMPGMNFKYCLTQKDIDEGNQKVLGQKRPGDKDRPDCQMKDMKQSGNTVNIKMSCKGRMAMDMDSTMTYTANGFKMNSKMTGTMEGQPMNMTQNMEVKYIGPCKS
jgi:Protein of unknown function (DUF3617)